MDHILSTKVGAWQGERGREGGRGGKVGL